MSKIKTSFFCQNCGTAHTKWQGQCNGCKAWNTIVEEVIEKKSANTVFATNGSKGSTPQLIDTLTTDHEIRIDTQDPELNRVLGGGIVPGAVILLGGEPGIGKSTLLLQLSLKIPSKVLYISGEESEKQIKIRAARMQSQPSQCYILTETRTQPILLQLQKEQPDLVIIDSIQTLHSDYVESSAGSVSQIKTCAAELIAFAKQTNTPILLVGHITKDGAIAGPKILEHMVDTVLHFEGDQNHIYRILRAQKNRFGATAEIGIYQMQADGLQAVANPSEILLSNHDTDLSGHAIAATVEGIRPMFVEIQALVSTAVYGTPQRNSTGFNIKRLNMLLAVLEKRAGFALGTKDVFINIAGGISIDDAALDLAVIAAILSSHNDIPIAKSCVFAAEIGLSGEIRPVSKPEQRIREAAKLGFETIVISKHTQWKGKTPGIKVVSFAKIEEILHFLFG
ncbi:MAG: DNA repair protein RadA [Bacteroidetes bacterium]|nr:DNA repair protein RadA [Bacteroidota bacterium]MDA0938295.1 DNA repair protein RadA [Bacteroidota bacterium]MDA1344590.1 DNA repair protein RadA [Bacteroidota bacterium]